MDEVDNGVDSNLQQVFECLIGPTPIPPPSSRVDLVPGNPVAGSPHPESSHQIQIRAPTLVMVGELIFVEGTAGLRPRVGNKRVLYARGPQERSCLRQVVQL